MEDLKKKIKKPLKDSRGKGMIEEIDNEEMLLDQSRRKNDDLKCEGNLRMKELEAIWE